MPSTWSPSASVTVNGVEFAPYVLAGLRINYGRSTIWEQARASYATVSISNPALNDFGFEVNQELEITVEDSTGTAVRVFTGKVTDITNELLASGSNGKVAVQTLTAVGPFAQMARTIVGTTNYPKEYDDDRITRILTEAGVAIDTVDTPGVYELIERSANPQDAYSLAASYAQMCFGYLYETNLGEVGYANESRRTTQVAQTIDLNPTYINWRGLQSRKSLSDIINKIILFYKNSDQVTSEDADSVAQYGLIEGRVDTELHNLDEAQNQADRYVSLRSTPRTNFSSFEIVLSQTAISNSIQDSLLNLYMGAPIRIASLPTPISPVTYEGFVEGWSLQISANQASITIISSDETYSVVPVRWQDVDPLTEWDDLDPTAVKTSKTNSILNPSFENNVTGWQGSNANYTVSQYTTDSKYGTSSMRVNMLAATGVGGGAVQNRNSTYRIPVANGQTWTVQCWVKNLIGTRNLRININTFATSTSSTAVEVFTPTTITNPTAWTQSTLTATFTNANSLWMEVRIQHSNTGVANDAFLCDGVLAVQESSNTYYWDGSTSDIPTSRRPELAWTGTAHLSTSTAEAYFGTIPTLTWDNVTIDNLP